MTPNVLYMAWQDPGSRTILPVARLIRTREGVYEFAYIRSAQKALLNGFQPLLSFPDLNRIYRSSTLPPLFSNRVMSRSREEFASHIAQLGLEAVQAEPFTVLARSGGRRTTDRLEVFAPPTIVADGTIEGQFLVRGVRHVPGGEEAISALKPGDRLVVVREPNNRVNALALRVLSSSHVALGYFPNYLADELGRINAQLDLVQVRVEQVNLDPAPVHHRLLCSFRYCAGANTQLFVTEDYRPISAEATSIVAA